MNSSITSHSTDSLDRQETTSLQGTDGIWMSWWVDIELPVRRLGLFYQSSTTYYVLLSKQLTFVVFPIKC